MLFGREIDVKTRFRVISWQLILYPDGYLYGCPLQ